MRTPAINAQNMVRQRAGTYIKQPTGYRAFVPARLPSLQLKFDDEMMHLLSQADRALGRLDGSIQTLPNPDLFVFMYVRKEAVLSSQIEGTQASLNDLVKAEAKIFDNTSPDDVSEVINYVGAMNHGLKRINELPLSVRLIREIHERLLHNVRGGRMQPGELRRSQNWIGPRNCTLMDATFVPPPHHLVPELLGDLELYLHAKDKTPLLIRIAVAHSQFESIHPFLDGNGRVGRLLVTFFLCSQNLLQKPVLYLSLYFRRHREDYYARLQRVRDYGEWEEWIKFFLYGIAEVAAEAAQTAMRIVALREDHRSLIAQRFGNNSGKAVRVLEELYRSPFVTVNQVKDLLGVSYPNANELVEKFTAHKLLREVTGQSRNRQFRYDSYMDLFSAIPTAAVP